MSFKKQAAAGRITAWTVSKIKLYDECPRKAKYKMVDKLPEPGSPALERGSMLDECLEHYVTNRSPKLHLDIKASPKIKKLADLLRKEYKEKRVRVQLELAFDRAWKACHWLAPNVYVRFKLDALHLLKGGKGNVIDWKSGRLKEGGEYDEQLNAYAVGVLTAGLVEHATAQLAFIDHNVIMTRPAGELSVGDLKAAQREWDKRAAPMLEDKTFKPTPGNACRWCPYSANKGGPCDF